MNLYFLQLKDSFEKNSLVFISLIIAFFLLSFIAGRLFQKLKDYRQLKKEREDAVKRSRAVLGGQFGEQIAPYLPSFPCNPGDARFIGKPVDFVAFTGTADGSDVKEILLIEVKSGGSTLTRREQQIKSAVEEGRVRFVEYHIN
ncbi:Holliday junction resolvase-like protein [Treponema sp.]|uniref:Holliday junction resolvase-like protein n=1 Tax=Treponema sp. TaxID=166 RepID=UPI0025D27562|nr:Holliday junction resolvase-like protein [Treponema sp.]MCR5217597.1 Holliday junction resolvase [Treponema sp.]